MKNLLRIPVLLTAFPALLFSQALRPDSAALHQAFIDLRNDAVLMDVSAHPDDEDGATLAYYRMRYGVRTYSVLFTRGEGGQNETGPELYEDLGVLRSAETEGAGRILGTRVRFLNFLDFGFSKTATETFHFWGGQMEPLRRLVYVIRKYKPDVLFTNHNTIDGHGHHQAAGITAIAAFDAAADSTLFPDQLREQGVTLWQPKKLFVRVFGRLEQAADVVNAVDDTDRVRGVSYLDIATQALRQHRTQGMERADLRAFGRAKREYRLIRASSLFERDSTTFFSGIQFWHDQGLDWLLPFHERLERLKEGMPLDALIEEASELMGSLDSLDRIPGHSPLAERMLGSWREKLETLLSLAAGITLQGQPADSAVVAGQRVRVDAVAAVRSADLSSAQFAFDLPEGWSVSEDPESAPNLSPDRISRTYLLQVGENAIPTLPKAEAQYQSLYLLQNVCLRLHCLLDGHAVSLRVPLSLEIAPKQELSLSPAIVHVDPSLLARGFRVTFHVINRMPVKTAGKVWMTGPTGWKADRGTFVIAHEDSGASGTLLVRPPERIPEGEYNLQFRTDYASATLPVHVFAVRVSPGLRVGIVNSYDNTLEEALQELHVGHALITDDELQRGDLSRWNTILIDIRAYLVREGLRKANGRLLDYVRNGGNLVVMYQRNQEWKPQYAPLPFSISRARITREDAPVEVLQPSHPLLTRPNVISASDWAGWKQERALYMPTDVDPGYTRILRSHDPDEPENDTGYLFTRWGKGSYIYTSYVWYRQLKEYHPGAFRCFADMISYPLAAKE